MWKKIKEVLKQELIRATLMTGVFVFTMCVCVAIWDSKGYKPTIPIRDYQIDVERDSVKVYDRGRYVGAAPWTDGKIDSLILNDNK